MEKNIRNYLSKNIVKKQKNIYNIYIK